MSGASPTPVDGSESLVVVVADDELLIAEGIGWILENLGYTPLVAVNGVQALALACQQWPVLLITDLMMPQMDGMALISAMRKEAAATGRAVPPIVAMTAADRHHVQEAVAALGADAVLPKPFDLTQIEALVVRLLRPRVP